VSLPCCFAYGRQECFDPFLFPYQGRRSGYLCSCSRGGIIMETEEHDCDTLVASKLIPGAVLI